MKKSTWTKRAIAIISRLDSSNSIYNIKITDKEETYLNKLSDHMNESIKKYQAYALKLANQQRNRV